MKLLNADLFLEIQIEENKPALLVIENPSIMANVVEGLFALCNGEAGDFILTDGKNELKFNKMAEIIVNPFAVDFNSRQIQNKLYSEMLLVGNNYEEEKAQIQTLIINYLDMIIHDIPYEMITGNDFLDLQRLFKMYEIRLEPECETLVEQLSEYSKVMARLLKKELLILTNICSYLSESDINSFVKMCSYQKIKMLFIENREQNFLFPVRTYIIDTDKCMIIR